MVGSCPSVIILLPPIPFLSLPAPPGAHAAPVTQPPLPPSPPCGRFAYGFEQATLSRVKGRVIPSAGFARFQSEETALDAIQVQSWPLLRSLPPLPPLPPLGAPVPPTSRNCDTQSRDWRGRAVTLHSAATVFQFWATNTPPLPALRAQNGQQGNANDTASVPVGG